MPIRKTSAKSKSHLTPAPARLSPVPSLGVPDDESTLGQADRDLPAKEGQTDLTSEGQTDLTGSQPVHLLCSLVRYFCPV